MTTQAHVRPRRRHVFSPRARQCAAWLYRPDGVANPPIVVLAHGFAAFRELRLDAYAERFAQAGYAALVFDYRFWGASAGEPRRVLDIAAQHADWRAAVALRPQSRWRRHHPGGGVGVLVRRRPRPRSGRPRPRAGRCDRAGAARHRPRVGVLPAPTLVSRLIIAACATRWALVRRRPVPGAVHRTTGRGRNDDLPGRRGPGRRDGWGQARRTARRERRRRPHCAARAVLLPRPPRRRTSPHRRWCSWPNRTTSPHTPRRKR